MQLLLSSLKEQDNKRIFTQFSPKEIAESGGSEAEKNAR